MERQATEQAHRARQRQIPFSAEAEKAPVVIVGIGGHGREVLDIVEAARSVGVPLRVIGFLDDRTGTGTVRGVPVLGTTEHLASTDGAVIIGIGSSLDRERVDQLVLAAGQASPVLVHPDATIGSGVKLGPGCVLWAGARLTIDVELGRHVHIGQNCTIGHDAVLEDYTTLLPGAALAGNVRIGPGVTVGSNASVLQGIVVGAAATVGAGAVVTRDVEPGGMAVGVPARPLRGSEGSPGAPVAGR